MQIYLLYEDIVLSISLHSTSEENVRFSAYGPQDAGYEVVGTNMSRNYESTAYRLGRKMQKLLNIHELAALR